MSPLPDGRLMIGTNKIDGDVRQEIDKSKQVCVYVYSIQSAITRRMDESVIYGNYPSCTHRTNKITRHSRRTKHEDVLINKQNNTISRLFKR